MSGLCKGVLILCAALAVIYFLARFAIAWIDQPPDEEWNK